MRPSNKGGIMQFTEYRNTIAGIGCDVVPDKLFATRDLVATLVPASFGDAVQVVRDVRYGSHERHRLDVFTSKSAPDMNKPLLVFVHGGGFIGGDKNMEGKPFYSNIAQWAVQQGFNAVNVTYRLAPESPWPGGIEDLRAAVEFLQSQGEQYGVSTKHLFLMGQSAGGAHVANYITHNDVYGEQPCGVTGVILLSGIYDYATMPPSPMEPAYLGTDRSVYAARSSVAGLAASALPLLVTVSEFDPPHFQQQGLGLLQARLREQKTLPSFVYAVGQNHLSVALYLGLPGDVVGPQIIAFIKAHSPC
jgi:acetyl esterase/lipase